MSCRSILKKLLFKGAITQKEFDKIERNLKTEAETPHGRLIDADVVIDRIDMNIDLYGADFPITLAMMRNFIEHAPTIIDAEE